MKRQNVSRESWWRDPSIWSDTVVFFPAFIAAILSVFDLLGLLEVGWFQNNLPKITVLLVSCLVLSSMVERQFLTRGLYNSLIGEVRALQTGPHRMLTNLYPNRTRLPRFREFVQSATEEIFISGVNLMTITFHETSILQDKAVSGCRIKMLLLDPGTDDQPNPILEPLQETFAYPELRKMLESSLRQISLWSSRLSVVVGKQVEVRTTKSVPTHSVIFLDKHLSSGKMQLAMLPPKTEEWGVLVEAERGGELYSKYVNAYDELWNEAQPYKAA